jgi:hypothetical protein
VSRKVSDSQHLKFFVCLLGLFTEEDFPCLNCEIIPSIILEEAKHFVTFMSSMLEEILGNEDFVAGLLKASGKSQAELSELTRDLSLTLDGQTESPSK